VADRPDRDRNEFYASQRMLDARYDDIDSGRVRPIDGEDAERMLRERFAKRRANLSRPIRTDP